MQPVLQNLGRSPCFGVVTPLTPASSIPYLIVNLSLYHYGKPTSITIISLYYYSKPASITIISLYYYSKPLLPSSARR